MNKDCKTVKTEKGFFESVIAPIIAWIIIILALLGKALQLIVIYSCILMIIPLILFIIASIVSRTYDGAIGGVLLLIPSVAAYKHHRKRKKN